MVENSVLSDHIEFLKNMVGSIIKGVEYYKGCLNMGILYIMVSDGIFYTVDVSAFFPTDVWIDFDRKEGEQPIYFPYRTKINDELVFTSLKLDRLIKSGVPIIYHEPDMRTNLEFDQIINSKTTDGSGKLHINTNDHETFMILFKNIFNLTKQDTIGLKVYDLMDGKLLSEFNIYKKKIKLEINMKFIFLDMNRNGG